MPTIRANGLDLAYQIDGDHPETLVLVNGLADAKESWEAQIPAFAERYRVVSYDNRGVGESPTPPGPYTLGADGRRPRRARRRARPRALPSARRLDGRDDRPGVRDRACRPPALGLVLLHLLLSRPVLPAHVLVLARPRADARRRLHAARGHPVGVHDRLLRAARGRADRDRGAHGRQPAAARVVPGAADVDRAARHARPPRRRHVPGDDAGRRARTSSSTPSSRAGCTRSCRARSGSRCRAGTAACGSTPTPSTRRCWSSWRAVREQLREQLRSRAAPAAGRSASAGGGGGRRARRPPCPGAARARRRGRPGRRPRARRG